MPVIQQRIWLLNCGLASVCCCLFGLLHNITRGERQEKEWQESELHVRIQTEVCNLFQSILTSAFPEGVCHAYCGCSIGCSVAVQIIFWKHIQNYSWDDRKCSACCLLKHYYCEGHSCVHLTVSTEALQALRDNIFSFVTDCWPFVHCEMQQSN